MRVELSKAASRHCAQRTSPLLVEMQLLFSCFVAKRTYFRDAPSNSPGTQVDIGLYLDFRATYTSTCDLTGKGGGITHNETPIEKFYLYVPSWCRIDYADGQWSCEFGYDRKQRLM